MTCSRTGRTRFVGFSARVQQVTLMAEIAALGFGSKLCLDLRHGGFVGSFGVGIASQHGSSSAIPASVD
jgi:hypothetical protein